MDILYVGMISSPHDRNVFHEHAHDTYHVWDHQQIQDERWGLKEGVGLLLSLAIMQDLNSTSMPAPKMSPTNGHNDFEF